MTEPRTVLITGAGTGIGAACARLYAEEGARLVLVGRRREPLEQVARDTGGLVLVGDAACPATWDGFIQEVRKQHGGLDVLLACAGGHGLGSATHTSPATWADALRSNLDSAFYSARACLPLLQESAGNIVLIGSIASLAAGPEVCGYTTAKHALLGLNRSLARDYGPHGVRVNAVCPGWVQTPMADAEMQPLMDAYGETLQQAYDRVCADVPLRRAARADEIARVCRFLASREASIITGATVVADGGSSIVDVPTLAFTRLESTHAP
ncbi:SDR family NAD(P)-dependent oxidoreductase [Pseudomonas sp. R5-89-07]|uniref:SDR family NAD(P)-dependent oxidoreductase n=1 Tax=Pseudomonas sp. R5-89-07 TaxID=658644 RepID=UPI000F582E01|nr:SDR family oxidoreductase [Pseudomonas sp. R5-89-07]AZF06246.1 MoaE protein [Pseudomonas sp. R5-89-07]